MRSLSLAVLLTGCVADEATPSGPVPDFSLDDVNPTSPTAGEPVSPRDAIGMRSAWYFGHAT